MEITRKRTEFKNTVNQIVNVICNSITEQKITDISKIEHQMENLQNCTLPYRINHLSLHIPLWITIQTWLQNNSNTVHITSIIHAKFRNTALNCLTYFRVSLLNIIQMILMYIGFTRPDTFNFGLRVCTSRPPT